MKQLFLQAEDFCPEIGAELENRGLISFIRHPQSELRRSLAECFFKGDDFPADQHGFHSVTITFKEIFLSSHPEGQNEIVFLWDSEKNAKPLYFVFALQKRQVYRARLHGGALAEKDYIAVRFPRNDPLYSSFIIWNGTVHCELTVDRHPATLYPSFFVLEPKRLTVDYTNEKDRGLELLLRVDDPGPGDL